MLSRLAENRLAAIQQGSTPLATFGYDGDGNPSINPGHRRVKATVSGVTTAYLCPHFE